MRPPSQGPEAIQSDIIALNRVLRRVQCDPNRTPKAREKLEELLVGAITLLLNGKRRASAKK